MLKLLLANFVLFHSAYFSNTPIHISNNKRAAMLIFWVYGPQKKILFSCNKNNSGHHTRLFHPARLLDKLTVDVFEFWLQKFGVTGVWFRCQISKTCIRERKRQYYKTKKVENNDFRWGIQKPYHKTTRLLTIINHMFF